MKIKKLISGSFWFIMAAHILAFTAIGLFTVKGWRLLIVFLSVLVPLVIVFWLLRLYSKRHPEILKIIKSTPNFIPKNIKLRVDRFRRSKP